MNEKLIEGMIGGILKFVPPGVWDDVKNKIEEGLSLIRAIDEKLSAIQKEQEAQRFRYDTLESIVRNAVPDAGPLFAERDMYMPADIMTIGGIPLSQIERAPPNG